MSRTPLVRELRRWLAVARFLERNPRVSLAELEERREFLKRAAGLALATIPGAAILSSCASVPRAQGADDPVIIVGGGIAGLSTAFHLARKGIGCEIYEASPRMGGRMFTRQGFNRDGMMCELGGEFVDTTHTDIAELCRFFGIPLDPLDANDAGLASDLYFFPDSAGGARSARFGPDAIRAMKAFNRKFSQDHRRALRGEIEAFDRMSLEQYLDGYHGRVDRWFLELLRVAWVGECGLEAGEQSAAVMVMVLDPDTREGLKLFGDSDQAKRIRGGNQSLIGALERWLGENGVRIHRDRPLARIAESGTRLSLRFGRAGAFETRECSRAVCAMPFTALRRVEGIFDLPLSESKKSCIREMAYATNGKLMTGYRERIWRTSPNPSIGSAYTDLFPQNVWETSRMQKGESGILTSFLGGNDGAHLSAADRERCERAIGEVFPGSHGVLDGNHALFNWTKYEHAQGSYAAVRPGQMPLHDGRAASAELRGRLFFAGEHTAPEFSGFMNGACLSGRLAAQKIAP